jgi:hypothetical protein
MACRKSYADVPAAEADAAAAWLTSQSQRAYRDEVTVTAWRGRPTTYVITEQDAIVPVAAQEALAARRGEHGAHGNKPRALPVPARRGCRHHRARGTTATAIRQASGNIKPRSG